MQDQVTLNLGLNAAQPHLQLALETGTRAHCRYVTHTVGIRLPDRTKFLLPQYCLFFTGYCIWCKFATLTILSNVDLPTVPTRNEGCGSKVVVIDTFAHQKAWVNDTMSRSTHHLGRCRLVMRHTHYQHFGVGARLKEGDVGGLGDISCHVGMYIMS